MFGTNPSLTNPSSSIPVHLLQIQSSSSFHSITYNVPNGCDAAAVNKVSRCGYCLYSTVQLNMTTFKLNAKQWGCMSHE